LFNYNHNLYIPKCVIINSIEIFSESKCFENFNVRFIYKNKFLTGFIQNNKILVENSSIIECANQFIYLHLKNLNQSVISNKNELKIVNNSRFLVELKPNIASIDEFNLIHETETLNGLNSEKDFKQQFYSNNVQSIIHNYDEPNLQLDNVYLKTFWWSVYTLIAITCISVLICTFSKCNSLFKKIFKKQTKNSTVSTKLIETNSSLNPNNIELTSKSSNTNETESPLPKTSVITKLKSKSRIRNVSKIPEEYL